MNMDKSARTNQVLHPVLHHRWSPRAFDSRAIPTDIMERMFEAARWSPSSSNEQPWRFIVGFNGDETHARIFDHLTEANRLWASSAPVLIAAVTKLNRTKYPERENTAALYDLGQSLAHLTFQAAADGLFIHQMSGFNTYELEKALGVPDGYKLFTVSAVGYKGNPEQLPPKLLIRELSERVRQPLENMVFTGMFGQAAAFLQEAKAK